MFCTGCGTKLDDDALFCRECGMKVEKPGKAAKPAKPAKSGMRFSTGYYLAALFLSILLPLYMYLWNKHFLLSDTFSYALSDADFFRENFEYFVLAALLILSCIILKVTRVPALITLLLFALRQFVYLNLTYGTINPVKHDLFTRIRLFATLAAFLFMLLSIICRGLVRKIVSAISLSLFAFLTVFSFVLGLHARINERYVFVGFSPLDYDLFPPFVFAFVFLTYTVISLGMISMERNGKKALSYVGGLSLAVLMSAAVIVVFSKYNSPENSFARLMERGNEKFYEKDYNSAISMYEEAGRIYADDPDVYLMMIKAAGKLKDFDYLLNVYERAIDNLGKKDLKDVSEKAWKILGNLKDDAFKTGQQGAFIESVYDFMDMTYAAGVELDRDAWDMTVSVVVSEDGSSYFTWGQETGGSTPVVAESQPVPAAEPAEEEVSEWVPETEVTVTEDVNHVADYFRVDPVTGLFTMNTDLFGMSFSRVSDLLGGLDPLEYWPHWGEDLDVTFVSDGVHEFALFFRYDAFVCCYYDFPEDGYIPNDIYGSAKSFFGRDCDSVTNPYGDGVTYFYNWDMPGYYYEQYNETYFDEYHFRQRYSTFMIYPH